MDVWCIVTQKVVVLNSLFGVEILKSNQHIVLGDLWYDNDRVGNWKDTMGT